MTTHTDRVKGGSQCERLLNLLKNKKWNTTETIIRKVYGGSHLGVARIAARAMDLKKRGHDIESKKVKGTLWAYRMV